MTQDFKINKIKIIKYIGNPMTIIPGPNSP